MSEKQKQPDDTGRVTRSLRSRTISTDSQDNFSVTPKQVKNTRKMRTIDESASGPSPTVEDDNLSTTSTENSSKSLRECKIILKPLTEDDFNGIRTRARRKSLLTEKNVSSIEKIPSSKKLTQTYSTISDDVESSASKKRQGRASSLTRTPQKLPATPTRKLPARRSVVGRLAETPKLILEEKEDDEVVQDKSQSPQEKLHNQKSTNKENEQDQNKDNSKEVLDQQTKKVEVKKAATPQKARNNEEIITIDTDSESDNELLRVRIDKCSPSSDNQSNKSVDLMQNVNESFEAAKDPQEKNAHSSKVLVSTSEVEQNEIVEKTSQQSDLVISNIQTIVTSPTPKLCDEKFDSPQLEPMDLNEPALNEKSENEKTISSPTDIEKTPTPKDETKVSNVQIFVTSPTLTPKSSEKGPDSPLFRRLDPIEPALNKTNENETTIKSSTDTTTENLPMTPVAQIGLKRTHKSTPYPMQEEIQRAQEDSLKEMEAIENKKAEHGEMLKTSRSRLQQLSESWSHVIRQQASDAPYIDALGIKEKSDDPKTSTTPQKESSNQDKPLIRSSLKYNTDSESDDDDEGETKNEFLDDEAEEAAEDEDSMDSEEREEMVRNEIPVDGISLGSKDSDDDEEEEDEEMEKDSFIATDDEVENNNMESETYDSKSDCSDDELISTKPKKFVRILPEESESEEDLDETANTVFKMSIRSPKNNRKSSLSETNISAVLNKENDLVEASNNNSNVVSNVSAEEISCEAHNVVLSSFTSTTIVKVSHKDKRNENSELSTETKTSQSSSITEADDVVDSTNNSETINESSNKTLTSADSKATNKSTTFLEDDSSDDESPPQLSVKKALEELEKSTIDRDVRTPTAEKSETLTPLNNKEKSNSINKRNSTNSADVSINTTSEQTAKTNGTSENNDERNKSHDVLSESTALGESKCSDGETSVANESTSSNDKENVLDDEQLSVTSKSLPVNKTPLSQSKENRLSKSLNEFNGNHSFLAYPLAARVENIERSLVSNTPSNKNENQTLKCTPKASTSGLASGKVTTDSPNHVKSDSLGDKKVTKLDSSQSKEKETNPVKEAYKKYDLDYNGIMERCGIEINQGKRRKLEPVSQPVEANPVVEEESTSTASVEPKKQEETHTENGFDEAASLPANKKRKPTTSKVKKWNEEPIEPKQKKATKNKKLLKIFTSSGTFKEEPITPPKVQFGFVESDLTPKRRSWKVETVAQPVHETKKPAKKRCFEETEDIPFKLKPKWVQQQQRERNEDYQREKRPKTSSRLVGNTQVIVNAAKKRRAKAASLIPLELVKFREKNLYRKGIPRQTGREMLKQEEKRNANWM